MALANFPIHIYFNFIYLSSVIIFLSSLKSKYQFYLSLYTLENVTSVPDLTVSE